MRIPLEAFVTSHFVRYDRLSEIVAEAFKGSNATELNIYIDMYSIIRSLYSNFHLAEITNYRALIACIINMCAHYREYFRKYLGVSTRIFIVHSNNCCIINRKFVSNYNSGMFVKVNTNKQITEMINDNIELLTVLCPYLPDIHFIRSEYETAVLISHLIDKEKRSGNENPNLIISRDPYMMQLVPIYKDTAILRSRKTKGEDTSYIIGPLLNDIYSYTMFWNHYTDIREIKRDDMMIHPCNISLLMAMTRVPERDLKSMVNNTVSKRFINHICGSNPTRCTVHSVFEQFGGNLKVAEEVINNRFKAIDIPFQRTIFDDTVESKMIKTKNLYDPNAVRQINDHYFTNEPLDLDKL